jgi:hypothetical protein
MLIGGELQLAVVEVHWSDASEAGVNVGEVPLTLLLVAGV